ncbi:MAG: glycosyltransferase family 4 protein [Rikenellaceae bacterium]|jgi:glycosyltransferase involved in cell wall biosynthesis|nr:glycosyltransferase family 4 protein [Rikenellaceae bacterium]
MKVLMLNTSDRKGGAAIAAQRLRQALEQAGVEVTMIVRDPLRGKPDDDDPGVISVSANWWSRAINRLRFLWERWVIFCHNGFTRRDLFAVSLADTGTDVSRMKAVREADVIHLHWINQGFLSLGDLRKIAALGKPIVWTLHDLWPVTGICHHAWECTRYQDLCGSCPFLHSDKPADLSRRIQQKKATLYAFATPHLVPVSEWLAEKCRESALGENLPITRIPNPLDTSFFSPGDQQKARTKLGLPADKTILLMGAARIDDPVKGFPLLREALAMLPAERKQELVCVLFGAFKDQTVLSDFPVAVDWRGTVSDREVLRELYRAADIFAIPSLEDNLPNTVMEAMACATPVVGFRTGGIPEMVDHQENGYLAPRNDVPDLARGIEWVLTHLARATLAKNAREKILRTFSIARVAEQYIELYAHVTIRDLS